MCYKYKLLMILALVPKVWGVLVTQGKKVSADYREFFLTLYLSMREARELNLFSFNQHSKETLIDMLGYLQLL